MPNESTAQSTWTTVILNSTQFEDVALRALFFLFVFAGPICDFFPQCYSALLCLCLRFYAKLSL